MTTLIKAGLAFFLLTTIFSCKKEAQTTTTQINAAEISGDAVITCNRRWIGIYSTEGSPDDTATDATFIASGMAKLSASSWSYFWTSIDLPITPCKVLWGDSTKFQVRLRNPDGQTGSVYPYDVSLWLIGTKDTAHVQFLAGLVQYTALLVGNKGITNTNSLIYQFQDWTTLSLEAKNNFLTVYKNGSLVQRINYSGTKIGRLRKIVIGFKGAGEVTWVKLYNSNTGAQLMQEDFDVRGHSNVIWF